MLFINSKGREIELPVNTTLSVQKQIIAYNDNSVEGLISNDLSTDLLLEAKKYPRLQDFLDQPNLTEFSIELKVEIWGYIYYNTLTIGQRTETNRLIISMGIYPTIADYISDINSGTIDKYIAVNTYTVNKIITAYANMLDIDASNNYEPYLKSTYYAATIQSDISLDYIFEVSQPTEDVPILYYNSVFKVYKKIQFKKPYLDYISNDSAFKSLDKIIGITETMVKFEIDDDLVLKTTILNKEDEIVTNMFKSLNITDYHLDMLHSYTLIIPDTYIIFEIMSDLMMNDTRFSVLFYNRNLSSKTKSIGDLHVAYHDVITNERAVLRFANKKEGLRVSISFINNEEHLNIVLNSLARAIRLYQSNYSIYERYYRKYEPNISEKYHSVSVNDDLYLKGFFTSKYTKKAAKKPEVIMDTKGIDPNRFTELTLNDRYNIVPRKVIVYCDDPDRPYLRWILNDLDNSDVYRHIVVCRKTVAKEGIITIERSSGRSNIILKERKLAKEDQLGNLHGSIDELLKKYDPINRYYRLGTTTVFIDESNPIPEGSYVDTKLGVVEPNNGLYIAYKWSFLTSILYALNIDDYQIDIYQRENITKKQIDLLWLTMKAKPYLVPHVTMETEFIDPPSYIRLLEYIYNIQIIVIYEDSLMPYDKLTILPEELTTRDTYLIYMHTGGTWGRLSCEVIINDKEETLFTRPIVNTLIDIYKKTQPVKYVSIPSNLVNKVKSQIIDNYGNVRYLIFNDSYCKTDPLYILDVPVETKIPSVNKKHKDISYQGILYTWPNPDVPNKSQYDNYLETRAYTIVLKQYCLFMFAQVYTDYNDINLFIRDYILPSKTIVNIELPYDIDESVFPIKMTARQIEWIKQQIYLDLKSISSYIERYRSNSKHILEIPDMDHKVYNINSILIDIPYHAYTYIVFVPVQRLIYRNKSYICYLVANRFEATNTDTRLNVLIIDNSGFIKSHIVTPLTTDDDRYIGVYKKTNSIKYIKMVPDTLSNISI